MVCNRPLAAILRTVRGTSPVATEKEKSMRTILVAVLALATALTAMGAPKVGDQAPEINAVKWMNSTGDKVSLADLKGKIVVVEFWATWCPPCRESIPHLVELNGKLKDKGVVFIGLTNEDETKAKIAEFVKKMKMDYIVGTGSKSSKEYGVTGIPTAFIIGKDGKVLWSGHPMNGMDKALDKALGISKPEETAMVDEPKKPARPPKVGASQGGSS